MTWFTNLSTRAKLLYAFGLILLFLGGVIAAAYWGLENVRRTQQRIYEIDFVDAQDTLLLRNNENGLRATTLTAALLDDPQEQDRWLAESQRYAEENDALLESLRARNSNNPPFLQLLDDLESIRAEYEETRTTQVVPLIRQGQIDEATELTISIQNDRYVEMRDIARELGAMSLRTAEGAIEDSRALVRSLQWIFVVLCLVVIAIVVALTTGLSRLIADPLQEISAAARQIGAGDLAITLNTRPRADEVGILLATFAQMVDALRAAAAASEKIAEGDLRVQVQPQSDRDVLGHALARMATNLRSVTTDINDAVQVLSSSAAEILASTSQLAAGATETAAAVSETTTTVEEVKQTSQVTSQKVRQVSESAQRAEQISQTGRAAVDESVEGMRRIRTQMESIGESLARLSEQSQAIAEIIASVNDLAEQSNLLAVNAAIEAAKAGEHGRGFAVVAQEVRNLAAQSKQATSQVRSILGDVQRATTAAVMAAEQGHRAVEEGLKQALEAGQSIQVLAETISQAAQAATQIAASSRQQVAGMDQAALAMDNIRQSSAQNAAGTKQAEVAARNLHEIGQKLTQLVAQYRI